MIELNTSTTKRPDFFNPSCNKLSDTKSITKP